MYKQASVAFSSRISVIPKVPVFSAWVHDLLEKPLSDIINTLPTLPSKECCEVCQALETLSKWAPDMDVTGVSVVGLTLAVAYSSAATQDFLATVAETHFIKFDLKTLGHVYSSQFAHGTDLRTLGTRQYLLTYYKDSDMNGSISAFMNRHSGVISMEGMEEVLKQRFPSVSIGRAKSVVEDTRTPFSSVLKSSGLLPVYVVSLFREALSCTRKDKNSCEYPSPNFEQLKSARILARSHEIPMADILSQIPRPNVGAFHDKRIKKEVCSMYRSAGIELHTP